MKKTLLAALFVMVITSWCLAQTDSVSVPGANSVLPETENKNINPTQIELGKKSAVTNWILGMEPASLALKDLPGTVFLQRRISGKCYLGLGFHYYISNEGPNEDYNQYDSTLSISERKSSTISLIPELSWKVIANKSYGGGIALSFDITKRFSHYSNEYRDETNYQRYSIDKIDNYIHEYSMEIPFFIEKYFKIWGQSVSLGLKNNILSASGGAAKHKHYREYYDEYSNYFGMSFEEDTDRLPKTFSLDNPFQGKTQVIFKYYF